jgi:SAM-dependent methyltransferase
MNEVQRYFDGAYFTLNFGRGRAFRHAADTLFRRHDRIFVRVAELLRPFRLTSVLELGCGSGDLLARLADEHPLQHVVGVDVSARSLAVARQRFRDARHASFELAPIQTCQALYASFDAVLSIGLFDYLPLEAPVLEQILRASNRIAAFTLPRARLHPQRLARRLWLGINRVPLFAYQSRDVRALCERLQPTGWQFTIDVPPGMRDNLWLVATRR